MKARDIMTPKPFVVTSADNVTKAAEIMRYQNIGGVPVVNNPGNPTLVGIITDRDIVIRCVARGHDTFCAVADVMTPLPLRTVLADADVSDVVRKMEDAEVSRIPVVTDDGILIGIVTESDIATKLSPDAALPLRKRLQQYSAEPHLAFTSL